ncbi:PspA-associated protein PspAB [Streptomyces sp. NPDC002523]
MGLLDILLGRTKPVAPDLDRLFALPSAAVTLEAAVGYKPTGIGAVCFATVEGAAFEQTHREVQALLDADTDRTGPPVELRQDEYGYSWLVSRRTPEQLPQLVNDLHAVNSSMEVNGFGPQLLCSLATFAKEGEGGGEGDGRKLALVYLYKRGTFYPLCTRSGQQKRDNPLELQIAGLLKNDLRIEEDLARWFPLWGAPGMDS